MSDEIPVDETLEPGLKPPQPRIEIPDLEPEGDRVKVGTDPEEVKAGLIVTELTPEERMLFKTFMNIGRLVETIDVFDHPVVIQTLSVQDELLVGLACKPYIGTEGYQRAYQAAFVTAAVRSYDDKPIFTSLADGVKREVIFEESFKVVITWFPIVVSKIYHEILLLEQKFHELTEKLGKSRG